MANLNASLLLNILLFYSILIAVNIPASFLGIEFESNVKPKLWYEPPGFVIPIVWFILFTFLGIARSILLGTDRGETEGYLFALAILCASYAYYTLGLAKLTHVSALWFGLAGNIIVILFAVALVVMYFPFSKWVSLLVLPVAIWTAYATLIVWGEMKLQKLI